MVKQYEQAKVIVEKCIREVPITRDSNNALFLVYMNIAFGLRTKIGVEAYETLKKIMMSPGCPAIESMTRARRDLQAQGICPGNEKKRRQIAANTAAYFRNHK